MDDSTATPVTVTIYPKLPIDRCPNCGTCPSCGRFVQAPGPFRPERTPIVTWRGPAVAVPGGAFGGY